jgi:biopolymer transport protein ExbD
LIDVVFLLIIFFLVASHFVRSEQAAAVELPAATAGQDDTTEPAHRLTITVDSDGTMSIAGDILDESDIRQRITRLQQTAQQQSLTPEVRIRSDRSCRYGVVRKLVEYCAARDIRSLKFAVKDSEP